ncbi:MAG TPA: porin [Acidobacteriota bacterium]|nr:porin [Acidobacteriota bacterium]
MKSLNTFLRPISIVTALAMVVGLLGLAASLSKAGDEDQKKEGFTIEWRDGFRLYSADGMFKLSFGGRVFHDWMWGNADDEITSAFGEIVSGNEFRTAWLYFSGEVYNNVEFMARYSFSGGDIKVKDLYIGLTKLPFGKLRIGHYKEPFSLEQLTSSKYTTFMERSIADLFAPARNTGFSILGANKAQNITWGLGVFTEANDYGEARAHDDTYNISGRLTFLPWSDGNDLLHLGAGYHYTGVNEGGSLRYSQRPEVHLTYRFVDTGNFAADSANTLGLEALIFLGPFSLQGEYMYDSISAPDAGDPTFQGGYLFGSYFLTPGDHRSYSKADGAIGRVKPKNPWMGDNGTGAVELALRYSWLDLTDAEVFGGELMDITLGLNWYINNVTRMMINYVYADRDDIGTASFFQTRFQIDF